MESTTCSGELMPKEALTYHLPYLTHIASLRVSQ